MLSASSIDADVYINPRTNNKNIVIQINAMELLTINSYLNLKFPPSIEKNRKSAKKIFGSAVGNTIANNAAQAIILLDVSANCASLFGYQFNLIRAGNYQLISIIIYSEFKIDSIIVVVEQPSIYGDITTSPP